ncbi:hypothetical protein RIF29_25507 [Crotalaria pallida]|uniref:Ribonuclease H1 N-terminal domain-containing protein n=1 Tax=Crotalaria pallida TaxID=3830 RepID=A0AAN9ELR0_CROPI
MEERRKGKDVGGDKNEARGYRCKCRFYNVYFDRQPGIYLSWHVCHMQVTGYSRASYEAFDIFEEAKESWDRHVVAHSTGGVPVHGDGGGEASSSSSVVRGSSDGGVDALPNIVNANLEAFLIGLMIDKRVGKLQTHLEKETKK